MPANLEMQCHLLLDYKQVQSQSNLNPNNEEENTK